MHQVCKYVFCKSVNETDAYVKLCDLDLFCNVNISISVIGDEVKFDNPVLSLVFNVWGSLIKLTNKNVKLFSNN